MAVLIPQVPRVREKHTSCVPDSTLTAARAGIHVAVKLDDDVAGDLTGKPRVGRTDTNNALDVYGEFILLDGGDASIQTGGIMVLRASAAYVMADNGFGVRSTATAGVVQKGASIGAGFGKIIGGGSVEIDGAATNVYVVDADA